MKNQHGIDIELPEEQLADIRRRIKEQLETLETINNEDAAIDRACVELSSLHSMFARKHTIMRRMRNEKIDLDQYAKAAQDALA